MNAGVNMRIGKMKEVVMKPNLVLFAQVAKHGHASGALPVSRSRLPSGVATMMAVMLLSVCPAAYSATEHDPEAHDASNKVYPSRALQGVVTPLAAGATLHKMTLSHHELEPWTFVPKRKDRIEIENRSNITHALYVTYPDGTVVNLEIQIPGDTVSWTVPDDAEGEYLFRCWIHPVIRAKMLIQD